MDDGRLEQSVTIKATIIEFNLQQHLTLLDKLREESLGDSSVPANSITKIKPSSIHNDLSIVFLEIPDLDFFVTWALIYSYTATSHLSTPFLPYSNLLWFENRIRYSHNNSWSGILVYNILTRVRKKGRYYRTVNRYLKFLLCWISQRVFVVTNSGRSPLGTQLTERATRRSL